MGSTEAEDFINNYDKDMYETSKKLPNGNWFSTFLRAFTTFVVPEVSTDWDESFESDEKR